MSNIEYVADGIRLDIMEDAMKSPVVPDRIVKPYELYKTDWWTIALNCGDYIHYYEYWGEPCWRGLRKKEEYKGLCREFALKKFMEERFPIIARSAGLVIKNWYFDFSRLNSILSVVLYRK